MQEQVKFYNAKQISVIMGICYAKALAFIKYSGINYIRTNRTYLVEKAVFNEFISTTKSVNVEL